MTHLFKDQPEIALFLGLTGAKIKGIDNVNCGLATHFIPSDRLNDFKRELERYFSEEYQEINYEKILEFIDGYAVKKYEKKNFLFINHFQLMQVFKLGYRVLDMYNTLVSMLDSKDEDDRNWSRNILMDIKSKSPLSLIVENELIKRGYSFKTYMEAIQNDIELSMKFSEDSDFLEGIRSLLIDKDKRPVWKIDSIMNIDSQKEKEIIDFYFRKTSFPTNF